MIISKKNKISRIVKYILPVFLTNVSYIFETDSVKNKSSISYVKRLIKYLTPEILHDLVKFPKVLSNIIKNKEKLRFTIKKRPENFGYYPCHIKSYEQIQKGRIDSQLKNYNDNVIIFFNIMKEIVTGGMLSIDRFTNKAAETMKDLTVIQSGLPLNYAVIDNPFFEYSIQPISFRYLINEIRPKKLLLNIPEVFLSNFIDDLNDDDISWLQSIFDFRINILNQSDELMPSKYYIEKARALCADNLTITAAHQRYCTKEKEKIYQCPIYLLTPFLPDFYFTTYEYKEKIIIFSPDVNPFKESIKNQLKQKLPDFEFITISKMKLDEYKKLISKAMFTITFGEGYDGYFIEPALSGSITFAVYNDLYFPKNLGKLDTLYSSWIELQENIIEDIMEYSSSSEKYNMISSSIRNEVKKFTNNDLSYRDLNELYKRFMIVKN